jgi:hypothetical protein
MREATVRTSIFESPDLTREPEQEVLRTEESSLSQSGIWNPEAFAREQIQGLVRQVFFSSAARPVRQIVLCSIEAETDAGSICRRVAEALSLETPETVAVMGGCPRLLQPLETGQEPEERIRPGSTPPLRRIATRVRGNLWLVPAVGRDGYPVTTASLRSYLGEMRREFEYSIVEGPPASESSEATAMAQIADGIILVLSARRTRRMTARRIKGMLDGARARLLGTILSDRVFPMPASIYRRL